MLAKAHLSELVDRAERKGQFTLICRHGKPAAAIVSVDVASQSAGAPRMSDAEIEIFLNDLAQSGDKRGSAAEDLRSARSRLDEHDASRS